MFDYIRNYYNMPWLEKGLKVNQFEGKTGIVQGTNGAHVTILLDGERHTRPYHPTWQITYLDKNDNVIADYKK